MSSEKERTSDESAVLRLSRVAEIALLRYLISFVRSKAQRGGGGLRPNGHRGQFDYRGNAQVTLDNT